MSKATRSGLVGLTGPIRVVTTGINVDETRIFADATSEESTSPQGVRGLGDVARRCLENQIERIVAQMLGVGRRARALRIVFGRTVGGNDLPNGRSKFFHELIGNPQGVRKVWPKFPGRQVITDATARLLMRCDDIVQIDVTKTQ